MSTMLKRVGAAILEAESTWNPKSSLPKEQAMALAALNAMRDPTEAMVAQGFATGEFENDAAFAEPTMAARVFTAMINAALQDAPKSV